MENVALPQCRQNTGKVLDHQATLRRMQSYLSVHKMLVKLWITRQQYGECSPTFMHTKCWYSCGLPDNNMENVALPQCTQNVGTVVDHQATIWRMQSYLSAHKMLVELWITRQQYGECNPTLVQTKCWLSCGSPDNNMENVVLPQHTHNVGKVVDHQATIWRMQPYLSADKMLVKLWITRQQYGECSPTLVQTKFWLSCGSPGNNMKHVALPQSRQNVRKVVDRQATIWRM